MTDENGTVHSLVQCLGKGGQGEVWLTASKRRVVKLMMAGSSDERLRRQIAFVKRADLSGLHVARPLALLQAPACGYVAEFLADMVPIRHLLAPDAGQAVSPWYTSTGGLRRRLRLLAHVGEAVGGLHARGLVYGDISHNNVFVSEPISAQEAWLIDLDNLQFDTDPRRAIYTPEYGAPEVVSGAAGLTTYSDAWAFAVLALRVLTLVHPLFGDLVVDGDPDLEEDALAGRLPWIEDPNDDRNRSSRGIPRGLVLSGKLVETANAAFGAGRTDRAGRPSVATWVERLHVAADRTVRCGACSATFFDREVACPWCDAPRPNTGTVRIHRWEPGRGVVESMGTMAQLALAGEPIELTRRTTHAETGLRSRALVATLETADHGIVLRAAPGERCWVTEPADVRGTRPREVTDRGVKLPLGSPDRSYVIHFEPIEVAHRIARIGGAR